jgi:hypothetical protein
MFTGPPSNLPWYRHREGVVSRFNVRHLHKLASLQVFNLII